MEIDKFTFKHPVRCVLSGPSCCGKTTFMRNLIHFRQHLFNPVPLHIIYTFRYAQPWFSLYPNVDFRRDLPKNLNSAEPSLLVIDDLLSEPDILREIANFFTRGSHHLNCSVFFLAQNLFAASNSYRNISLNASHFVLFKTARGIHQIQTLGRQIYGKNATHFLSAYKDSTHEPFGYLLLDLDAPHILRTKIFPNQNEEIYVIEDENS